LSKHVLLIEDDVPMQELISDYLSNYGYRVAIAPTPSKAMSMLGAEPFDLVILDLMLPEMDGFDVAKRIKNNWNLPIIISSARGDIGNKIHGYELGADDYLAKPYEPRELVLRIEAVLRRYAHTTLLEIGTFTFDEAGKTLHMENYPIELTPVEFEIFLFLAKNRGNNVSREQITHATSLDPDTKARTIDTHISNIRLKIGDDAKNPHTIKSVWGIGYRFIG
jgi:two-component system, OmpR family, response regulator